MKQHVALITLPVADLEVAQDFYCGTLGWSPVFTAEEVMFFQMNGLVLGLITRAALEKDMGHRSAPGKYPFTLAHTVNSRDEVDNIINQIRAAGATILKEPVETDWGGYSGYFTDPDNHCWEVAHNPFWQISEEGYITVPPQP
mgnify:CR=1 FL=1